MTKIQRLSWIIRAGLIYSHEPSRQNRRWSEKFESRGLHMSPMVGRWRGPRGKETIALVLKITRNYVLLTTWRNVKVGSSPASHVVICSSTRLCCVHWCRVCFRGGIRSVLWGWLFSYSHLRLNFKDPSQSKVPVRTYFSSLNRHVSIFIKLAY